MNNIPQGYKLSPLGVIPQDWKVRRLGEIAHLTSGATPLRANDQYFSGGTIPWIKTADLNNAILYKSEECVTDKALDETSIKILPKETVLVAMYGGFNQIGRTALLGFDSTINQALCALLLNKSIALPKYVLYWLNAKVALWRNFAASSRKDPNITSKDVSYFPIVTPPLSEQERIAEVLGTWDEAIDKQSQLVNALECRKRALMQQLLTARKRLPNFSAPWQEKKYSDILKEVKRKLIWDDNELYRLISVKRRSGGLFERESLYGNQILTKNLRPAFTGDFLISKMQIVHGASGLTTSRFDNMKISGSYIALVAKDSKVLDIEYYDWYSKMPYFYYQTYISSFGVHIEKMTFDLESFMALGMKLPPLEEQKAIAQILTTADREIELATTKLNSLRTQKRALMQQLLTGKKRLKI